ncbi:MAG: thioredoxin-like domain-containing protein [Phycisphaerales bacterium JB047]
MHTSTHKRSIALLSLITITGGALGMGALLAPSIQREGDAKHIAEMQQLETKPFDLALFDSLSDWTHDKQLNASAIEGKVVLLGLVDSASPQSMLTLSTLARYERQNSDDGLVVLAVHPEFGWDAISEKVNEGRVRVQVAKDKGNAFAEALKSDDTPDLYLIDRAGQLRYADFESRSLKRAVGQLLRESPEEAIENAALQAQGIEVAAEDKAPAAAPDLPTVTSADYEAADWPEHNTRKLSAKDMQGKPLPVALGNEEWLSEKKPTEGKVLVLDFWATWCGPCRAASPKLEEIQREYEGKVEVLAIGGSSDDEGAHKKYVIANKKAYSNLYDKRDHINNALQVRGIPHTVVMSSDGVIRWQGNPLNRDFKKIVEQVINADPLASAQAMGAADPSSTGVKTPGSIPDEAYAKANWPEQNKGKLYAANNQGKKLPAALGNEEWISEERETEGKVIMLDFWATWCPPCREFSPIADRLQKKYEGKLEVLAISGQRDPESDVRSYIAKHRVSYSHLYDDSQRVYKALKVSGIPHVVIMSTDGVIRWQGFPLDPSFEQTLDQIIASDPMFENEG